MDSNNSNKLLAVEAEQSVLGGLLLEPDRLPEVFLHPEDFHDKRHRLIFAAMLKLSCQGEPIDSVTLTSSFHQDNRLNDIGGASYFADLMTVVPTAVSTPYYCRLVREASARRRLADVGRKIGEAAHSAESAAEALDQAETSLLELRSSSVEQNGPVEVSRLLKTAIDNLEKVNEVKGEIVGIPTGFHDLDRKTCGLQSSDLIIIAGRPSMGKTALGLNIAENAALSGNRVLVFSLEMSKQALVNRLIASNSKVDAHRFRNGQFQPSDWQKLTDAAGRIHHMPLLIDDTPAPTALDIRAASRRVMRDGGLALVVIDYLQLMRSITKYNVREREVAEISRSLKALAKELNIPVIVLAQLNRNLEAGTSPRRPIPSDLRESGSLEQDADLILFPWREAAYCPECRQHGRDCGKNHFRTAEIIIGKQRNGPVGSVPAAWLPEFCRFENLRE